MFSRNEVLQIAQVLTKADNLVILVSACLRIHNFECLSFKNLKFFSIDIHFGYGTLQETEKGAFVLNGCVINPQTPNFHCENCNIQFGRRKRFLRS